MVIKLSIMVFITQLIFLGCRTWNVKAIADKNVFMALISGAFVNLSWLVSIAIGSVSMHEIITNFEWQYTPVVIASMLGGLAGTWLSMRNKRF